MNNPTIICSQLWYLGNYKNIWIKFKFCWNGLSTKRLQNFQTSTLTEWRDQKNEIRKNYSTVDENKKTPYAIWICIKNVIRQLAKTNIKLTAARKRERPPEFCTWQVQK